MGGACSAAKAIKLDNMNGKSRTPQKSRSKSIASNTSTVLGIDKSLVKIPLNERDIMTLMRSWEKVHLDITKNGMSMFVRYVSLDFISMYC